MKRDIQLSYNSENKLDIGICSGDFALGNGLENRILISIFTWGPASSDDVVPDGVHPGGYWGDNVESSPDDVPASMGSRLWLLNGKITDETVQTAVQYIKESIAWLKDEPSVASFTVRGERHGMSQLDIIIEIILANGETQRLAFADILNWGNNNAV